MHCSFDLAHVCPYLVITHNMHAIPSVDLDWRVVPPVHVQATLMDQLEADNRTWRNYYNDTPWEVSPAVLSLSSLLQTSVHVPDVHEQDRALAGQPAADGRFL